MTKRRTIRIAFSFILVLNFSILKAQVQQESVMNEISYPFLNKLIDTARKYYPKVQSYTHRLNIADINIRKAKLSWFDLFNFTFLYSPNNSTTLVNPSFLNGYQVGLYFNVASLFTKSKNVKQAQEEKAIAKLEQEQYLLNLDLEVKTRYFRYITEQTKLKMMTAATVDAENSVKNLRIKFERSEDTFENYSRALLVYADRRQSTIEAEGAVLIARSALEELICKKLEAIN
ncbi:TolC family protein [Sediminibacterium ginsengisoli]|uniref:Outer membrane efflux protein n=1 Tax=Sediminibacterium ginsengisoli TaxID=413434 RepID=A0A1T4RMR6_9BACT|nr:TolC family protein [Sediminibacterium ginsengisoli]SKA17086.1 Outer membrane efflux protein [Sediminibacterium ginsengisoli]